MIHPFYVELGEEIRRRREALGMTQSTLATHLGLSRTSVTNIERGRQPVLVHQLYRVAQVLKIKVTDLLLPEESFDTAVEVQTSEEIKLLLERLETSVPGEQQ